MKFCMSARQPKSELRAHADEIRVEFRDINYIYDLLDEFEDTKTYILEIPRDAAVDWDVVESMAARAKYNFICAIKDIGMASICKERNLKFFWDFLITSFYEMQALAEVGVCFLPLGIPVIFDMDLVKNFNIPIRLVPNIAHENYLPHQNGITGQWIRPEDLHLYEDWSPSIDFRFDEDAQYLQKERTMYHIYAENKTWPGNLNILITNLNHHCENPLIAEGIGERRMNCHHRCASGRMCHGCQLALDFGKTIRKYVELKKENEKKED